MEDRFWCDEPHIWAMFYATIAGFQFHPKNSEETRMTHVQIAAEADAMYMQYLLRRVQTGGV